MYKYTNNKAKQMKKVKRVGPQVQITLVIGPSPEHTSIYRIIDFIDCNCNQHERDMTASLM